MNPEVLFSAANTFALVGCLFLAVLPRWRWTERLVLSGGFSLVLAGLYLVLLVRFFGSAEGGFGSLEGVRNLFQEPYVLLAGWVHYLAFDLFVGCWEARDARARNVPHAFVLPCLALTFLFGPVGLLAYYGFRSFWRGQEGKADA